jgi:hypothetical protein
LTIRDDLGPTFLPEFTPILTEPTEPDDDENPNPPRMVEESRDSGGVPGVRPAQRPDSLDDGPIRTGISSGGSSRIGDPRKAAQVIGGLVGLAFVIGAGILAQLHRRDLRRPTKAQTDGFADPVARILSRHTDLSMITPDLGDIIEAGSAVGEYLTSGPILVSQSVEYADDEPEPEPEPEPMRTATEFVSSVVPTPPINRVTYL